MSRRTLATFHRTGNTWWRHPRVQIAISWAGSLLVALAVILLAALLVRLPEAWRAERIAEISQAWSEQLVTEADALEKALLQCPVPGPGFPGPGEATRRLLEQHPLLVAAIPRAARDSVWVPAGDAFQRDDSALAQRFLGWAGKVEELRIPKWNPDPSIDPDHATIPSLVLVDRDWIFIKRWIPGSAAVERHLRLALGPQPRARVGIWPAQAPHPKPTKMGPFEPPNLQTWPGSSMQLWNLAWISTDLGSNWEMVLQPWPEVGEAWTKKVETRAWLARGLSWAVGLSLFLGWWLRRGRRRQESLQADRLAALTHSLKTPLALHKLRCDSLRTGRLSPTQQQEELLRLGQEIDDLTGLIERALVSLRGGNPAQVHEPITAAWLLEQAEEFAAALRDGGRDFEAKLCPEVAVAHPEALQTALQTLLENAYYHGAGRVCLHSESVRGRIQISISDEGPGLSSEMLEQIGKPFLRLRTSGQEGFSNPGQGLGLSLLTQIARQEGWGFHLESQAGEGLTARLELSRWNRKSSPAPCP